MHSATIPLAALATFAGVYWLAPAPAAAPQAAPAPIVEAPATVSAAAEGSRSSAVPTARRARAPSNRPAHPRVKMAARGDVGRPVRPVRSAPQAQVYFSGCNEVRAAGLAPLFRGQPGYRPGMDGDNDGIACESYRGRR
jgi:Excalibur calcium-binding domain